jgi:hypothetical protein
MPNTIPSASRSFRSRTSPRRAAFLLAASLLTALGAAQHARACPPADGKPGSGTVDHRPTVRIALLLDTSNSMDGLIAQAKTQLWSIVTRLSESQRGGMTPKLRIALYEYGNNGISAEANYVRLVQPFTDSLDSVSEQLFGLRTNGGSEFCGAVIERAARDLDWQHCPGDLNLIVIAGNEPFTQGGVDYRLAVPEAVRKHIVINTIFCGDRREGVQTNWQDGAVMGKGTFHAIEQDKVVQHVPSPYDDDIRKCNDELNSTYLPYGTEGARAAENQARQDENARSMGAPAAMQRAAAKASSGYTNSAWDLVDAVKDKKVDLGKLEAGALPPALKDVPAEQRAKIVAEYTERRTTLQVRIRELETQRQRFIAQQQGADAANTLGDVLAKSIEEQAGALGYEFQKK